MTVAARKRSTLRAIVPWGLQRRRSRERRGGTAVPGTGSPSSSRGHAAPGHPARPRAASLKLPGSFYWSCYFLLLLCFFFFFSLSHFSLPALNFTQLPGPGAAVQGSW